MLMIRLVALAALVASAGAVNLRQAEHTPDMPPPPAPIAPPDALPATSPGTPPVHPLEGIDDITITTSLKTKSDEKPLPISLDKKALEKEQAENDKAEEADKTSPVTLVLMDGRYTNTYSPERTTVYHDAGFNCWAERFVSKGKKMPLSVYTLDNKAVSYMKDWTAKHPDVKVHLDHHLAKNYAAGSMFQGNTFQDIGLTQEEANQSAVSFRKLSKTQWPSEYYSKSYWKAIESSLKKGHPEVLHSDLDAYYEKDPWELLDHEDFAGYDLVASPQQCHLDFMYDERRADVCTKMNSTIMVNTGFTLWRNTPATMEVMEHFNAVWKKGVKGSAADDRDGASYELAEQFMLNELLAKRGCEWQRPRHHGLLRGHCGNLKVAFLKKTAIQRGAGTKLGRYVTHARDDGQLVLTKYCPLKSA